MKPIGPYVAARNLPAGPDDGPIRTLRATDRVTGMPVLLHVLPFAPHLPELPEHPHLLGIVDGGMDGTDAYVVTELPMQATPASDPLLAARDTLTALDSLHTRGLTHGGISAAQLWEVDGRVALAGAGLPWHDAPTTGRDLRALSAALEIIGILPPALIPLRTAPDDMDAGAALALLNAPPAVASGAALAPPPAVEAASPEPEAVAEAAPPAPEVAVQTAPPATPAREALPVQDAAHDGTPIVLGGGAADDEPTANGGNESPAGMTHTPDVPLKSRNSRSAQSRSVLNRGTGGRAAQHSASPSFPEPSPTTPALGNDGPAEARATTSDSSPPTEAAPPAPVVASAATPERVPPPAPPPVPAPPIVPTSEPAVVSRTVTTSAQPLPDMVAPDAAPDTLDSAPPGAPVPAYSNAPAGTVETPQERRRRQNTERLAQAKLDAQAAAARKVERLRAEALARPPTTVQIGFTGPSSTSPGSAGDSGSGSTIIGDDDLPDWIPPAEAPTGDGSDPVGRPQLRMRNVERLPESLRRAPEPEPEPTPMSSGRLPARHMPGGPIRIGWDEDDSWRVVKTVEGPPVRESRRMPRWLLPLLGLLALLAVLSVAVPRLQRPATPAVTCCDVAFTLRGAAGATARLTVAAAPAAAKLTPGQELGRAPGTLHLPVAGTYRLRVVAAGYAPGELSVTVPRSQPVSINLGP